MAKQEIEQLAWWCTVIMLGFEQDEEVNFRLTLFLILYILIFLILVYAYIYIYSWLLKTYLWFSWPHMIVDFQSNGSTIPTFPKSSTTLVESFSASRHRKKNRTIALQTACSTFCFLSTEKLPSIVSLYSSFTHVLTCFGMSQYLSIFHPKMASNWKFLAEAMLQRPRKSKVSVFCLRRSRAEKHGENGEKKIVVQYSRRVWEVDAHHLICYPLHISVFRSLRTSQGSKMFSVELHIVTSYKLKNLINSHFPHFQWFSCLPFFSLFFPLLLQKNRLFSPFS